MPPGAVEVIKFERLRSSSEVPVIGTRMSCNPGGPSHGSVKSRYIKPTNYGREVYTDDNGITVPAGAAGSAGYVGAVPPKEAR